MMMLHLHKIRLISVALFCLLLGCESPPIVIKEPVTPPVYIPPPPPPPPSIPPPSPELQTITTPNNEEVLTKAIDALHLRLIEAYTNYWPLIPSEHQHKLLPEVLGDPIPELRAFGIERVSVLLRDGDATEEELQLVVDRLRDESPVVRLAAAKLLPEINVPGLTEYVAHSIGTEVDQQVTTLELVFFQMRPHPSAIDPVIVRLKEGPIEAAAQTLIVLLNSIDVSDERKEQVVNIVQETRKTNSLPSLVTLEAMLGDESTQRNLIDLLDSPEETIRHAVAQGFASAGFAEPLIRRADDPAIYIHAIAALQQQGDIEAFKELMNLHRGENSSWDSAVFAVASSLDTSSLLRADDMLKRLELNNTRLSIMKSVWEDSSTRTLTSRKAIARRAVPLMIETGDAVGALQLLDAFGESIIDEDILTLRFSAAIAASAWDAAADARAEPTPWIAAWNTLKENNLAAASVVRQQILQRFDTQLTTLQRETLGVESVDATPNQIQ